MTYTNTITLEREGEDENAILGGYTTRHKILSCDVDLAVGKLNYFRLSFLVPAGVELKEETRPCSSACHSKHVSELGSLVDEEIDELTHKHGSPSHTNSPSLHYHHALRDLPRSEGCFL